MRGLIIVVAANALAILACLGLGGCGTIPCAPNTCTADQLSAEDRLPPIPVDLGPYRDGKVTVE